MAKENTLNPTVRILVIGTAGAGKNCLESRFTTSQYPPPYDPSLTLCSRRFITLDSKPSSDGGSRSSTLPGLRVTTDFQGSTPSLLSPPDSAGPASPISDPVSPISFVSTTSTLNTSTTSVPFSSSFGNELEPPRPQPCAKCTHRASTYLVEVVNYPALQSAKVRQHVLAKCEYDAVLLVYDVSDRSSFDKVREFHSEVSLISSNSNKHHKRQRSHVPRRHSGPPTGSSLQRRSSVMSFFSPGGGLAGTEEDVEAGKDPSDNVVIALVGNKADIGDGDDSNLSESAEGEDGLADRDDDFDDDCESAIAVFGDALHRDPHEEEKAKLGAALSALGTNGRPKPTHAESSETVERWLQVVGRAAEEDDEECGAAHGPAGPGTTTTAASRAKPGRSVSKAEGEDLARSLGLQAPFLETSARTGANVEEAFEAVVRAVLRQMGRAAAPPAAELARRCRERHEAEQQRRASRPSRPADRMAPSSAAGPSRGQGTRGRLVLQTKLDGQGQAAHLERPALVASAPGRENMPRRESFMDRMRRILTSEEARGGESARGPASGQPLRSL